MSTPSKAEPAVRGRTHAQFEGPIGNPKAGKRARYSFRGGWHKDALPDTPATRSLVGNASK